MDFVWNFVSANFLYIYIFIYLLKVIVSSYIWDELVSKIIIIYIYAFSRRFYPKRLTVHSGYTFFVSISVLWELNPQPFALLMQYSTTEPQEHSLISDSLPLSQKLLRQIFSVVCQWFDSLSLLISAKLRQLEPCIKLSSQLASFTHRRLFRQDD